MTNSSYLDMTMQRSMQWSKPSTWSGVSEWIGMVGSAFFMEDKNRKAVQAYLASNVTVDMHVAPSGHTVVSLVK